MTEAQSEALAKARAAKAAKNVPTPRYGQAIRVLLPKARDPVQRRVTALVSEIDDEPGSVLAWCVPGRSSSELTVQVIHRSLVTDTKAGWWEAVA